MNNSTAYISDGEVSTLLNIIHEKYGYDFTNYSKASMLRRIIRFMNESAIYSGTELQHRIADDDNLFAFFLQQITVNVTEMFRDPLFYQALKTDVFPTLATYPVIKIWHAGCSSGEEVFSTAIFLYEAGLLNRCRIYATDINPMNIEKAKKGIISSDVMKEYIANYLNAGGEHDFASYYTARYDNAIIRKDLRSNILFSHHNLVTDQVFNEFQLIFCRNVMIYFNKQLQSKVIKLFYESLSQPGYLVLGLKESLLFADTKHMFEEVSHRNKIFRKKSL